MRSRIIIETDRAKSETEKQTEILLDIRDLLTPKEKSKPEPFGGPITEWENFQK